jgi:hypothetical protein
MREAKAGVLMAALAWQAQAGPLQISSFDPRGAVAWSNAFSAGVCTLETAAKIGTNQTGGWLPWRNYFTTNSTGSGIFAPPAGAQEAFFRLRAVEISTNRPWAFTNFVESYGLLHTIAGSGADPGTDNVNYWQPSFEGGYATNAALSRPHFAMEDDAGNVFIVDKNSDSVLKVTTDGRIYTVAGTHNPGNGTDAAAPATAVELNQPNGLWVRGDGVFYVLDTGNGKVRKVNTNGVMTTLFTDSSGINTGRGLWVKDDESVVFYCSSSNLKEWTPAKGVSKLNKQFDDLGNIFVSGATIVATDRSDNTVWQVSTNDGSRTLLFGNGNSGLVVDGSLAATNSLWGVRGVWEPPIGGYFLATDEGAQFLYVDVIGAIHVLVNGADDDHAGDGQWFYTPSVKFGQLRSVWMDKQGNLLIVENDVGFVRKIDFQRLSP